jgi:membrane protein implicated in regulation of membrane protease activity
MKVINAVYNFLVGDIIILVGITFAVLLLVLIYFVPALLPIRAYVGAILIVAILVVLAATLGRELRGREKKSVAKSHTSSI